MGGDDGVAGRKTRVKAGSNPTPTYVIIDSQRTKTTSASENRGYDGGKKIKGRKRHIVVDTLGCLLAITIHVANIRGKKSEILSARGATDIFPFNVFVANVCVDFKSGADVFERIKPKFQVLPLRWRVERTFGWANRSRSLPRIAKSKYPVRKHVLHFALTHVAPTSLIRAARQFCLKNR